MLPWGLLGVGIGTAGLLSSSQLSSTAARISRRWER